MFGKGKEWAQVLRELQVAEVNFQTQHPSKRQHLTKDWNLPAHMQIELCAQAPELSGPGVIAQWDVGIGELD